jgi:hypothetical protein
MGGASYSDYVGGASNYEDAQRRLATVRSNDKFDLNDDYAKELQAIVDNRPREVNPFGAAPDLTDDAVKRARQAAQARFAASNPGFLTGPLGTQQPGTAASAPKLTGS